MFMGGIVTLRNPGIFFVYEDGKYIFKYAEYLSG
jgi:hypothetical protein